MDGGISLMAVVFRGSGEIPCWLITWPRKVRVVLPNSHFWWLSMILTERVHSIAACIWASWSWPFCQIPKHHPGLLVGLLRWHSFFWKKSGALDIPKGSLLKQHCSRGIINVGRYLLDSARGTCQNQLFVSNLESTLAPTRRTRVSSTCGIEYRHWVHFLQDVFIKGFEVYAYPYSSWLFLYYHHAWAPHSGLIHLIDNPWGFHLFKFILFIGE